MSTRTPGALFLADNLLGFEAYSRAVGLDPTALLERVDLSSDALNRPGQPIPFTAGAELLRLAAAQACDPLFGFRFATHQSVQFMPSLAPAALAAPTVRAGIERATETFRRYSSATIWELTDVGSSSQSLLLMRRCDPRLARPPQLTMHAVTMAFRLLQALFGQLSPDAVVFDHARPGNVQTMRRFFGAPLRFDHPVTGLVFKAGHLDRPTQVTERRLAALLGIRGDGAAGINTTQQTMTDQLRLTIDQMLGSRSITLHAASRTLRLHPRSLRRRLALENMRFSKVVAEVRLARACHYLAHGELSLSEIAIQLGYADLSAFSRAFTRAAGISPSRWRRANRGAA